VTAVRHADPSLCNPAQCDLRVRPAGLSGECASAAALTVEAMAYRNADWVAHADRLNSAAAARRKALLHSSLSLRLVSGAQRPLPKRRLAYFAPGWIPQRPHRQTEWRRRDCTRGVVAPNSAVARRVRSLPASPMRRTDAERSPNVTRHCVERVHSHAYSIVARTRLEAITNETRHRGLRRASSCFGHRPSGLSRTLGSVSGFSVVQVQLCLGEPLGARWKRLPVRVARSR
jgi:hypothetical protein